ncbi:MAG: hypothetical protein ACK5E6_02885 [Cyanobacteriota bacterium]
MFQGSVSLGPANDVIIGRGGFGGLAGGAGLGGAAGLAGNGGAGGAGGNRGSASRSNGSTGPNGPIGAPGSPGANGLSGIAGTQGFAIFATETVDTGRGNDVADARIGGFGGSGLFNFGAGNDKALGFGQIILNGEEGIDRLFLPGPASIYTIAPITGGSTYTKGLTVMTVLGFEAVSFDA